MALMCVTPMLRRAKGVAARRADWEEFLSAKPNLLAAE